MVLMKLMELMELHLHPTPLRIDYAENLFCKTGSRVIGTGILSGVSFGPGSPQ